MDEIFQQHEEMANESGHDAAECYFWHIQNTQSIIEKMRVIAQELKAIRAELAQLENESWKN